jgi:glycerol-3-phosphate dehydrogenase (NAD(P)+)
MHDGLRLGSNSRAALITRGMSEMIRFAVQEGARSETLMGLSGLGDAMLSCTSDMSRNYRLGFALAGGASLERALRDIGSTVEGVGTTHLVSQLAEERHLDLPITCAVRAVLEGSRSPSQVIADLMMRPWKYES